MEREEEEEEEELLRNQSVRNDQLMYSTKLRIERKGVCVDKKVQWKKTKALASA